jgi:hypothetical protein
MTSDNFRVWLDRAMDMILNVQIPLPTFENLISDMQY